MTSKIENNFQFQDREQVTKFRVPDDDMMNWIEVLKENGFSEEELSEMMIYLNKTFRDQKDKKFIDKEFDRIISEEERRSGRIISENLKAQMRNYLELKYSE